MDRVAIDRIARQNRSPKSIASDDYGPHALKVVLSVVKGLQVRAHRALPRQSAQSTIRGSSVMGKGVVASAQLRRLKIADFPAARLGLGKHSQNTDQRAAANSCTCGLRHIFRWTGKVV
jgi:hypothetical protein